MVFRVTLRDEVTYFIIADDEDEAIDQAHEFWVERDPSIDECKEAEEEND